jgi:phosphate transport system protein
MTRQSDSDFQALKDLTLKMGGYVEQALGHAYNAILNRDPKAFEEVRRIEIRINDLEILIDESCVSVLAKLAPVANDLRLVFAISKINADLERMGDQAVKIVRDSRDLFQDRSTLLLPSELKPMIEEVRSMVTASLNAFACQDVTISRQVLAQDDVVDKLRNQLVHSRSVIMKQSPERIDECLIIITVAKNLERVADHATNIAEEVIFLVTGNDVRHGHFKAEISQPPQASIRIDGLPRVRVTEDPVMDNSVLTESNPAELLLYGFKSWLLKTMYDQMNALKRHVLVFVSVAVLGGILVGVVANYSHMFSKHVKGQVVDVQLATDPTSLLGWRTSERQVYSYAILIHGDDGMFYTASSEDRQWQTVKSGHCVDAIFYRYPLWNLKKANTFFNAQLKELKSCTGESNASRSSSPH